MHVYLGVHDNAIRLMAKPITTQLPVEAAAASPAAEPAPIDLAEAIETYQSPLLRYVGQILGSVGDEAEDVVQDVFLRLHKQIQEGGADRIQKLSVWLYRVAHNLAIDIGRKRTRRKRARDQVVQRQVDHDAKAADEVEGLSELIRREAGEQALAEVAKLPENQRQMIMLKIISDMTVRQIAEVVGCSPSNVCYQVNQGLGTLARRLKQAQVI